jgi:mono/diheme cytochrome c family protein
MKSVRTALLLVASFAFAAACGEPPPKREWRPEDHGQPAVSAPEREPQERTQETSEQTMARAAAALWNASCAGCHGRDGRGQGSARPPAAQMPDFTTAEWQTARSDAQLEQVIRDGRGMMPPFGKQVNDNGISALIAHIRRFAPAAGSAPPSEPQGAPR